MGVDVTKPAFNLEPQYMATMLTREDLTKATGASLAIKGLFGFKVGSSMREGTGAGVYWQSVGRRLSFSLCRYATNFQAETFDILACVCAVQSQNRSEKFLYALIIMWL